MSLHLFGNILTAEGVAANNRGESEGNITTLQKLLWKGTVHTTVSAEAIRWAVRYHWQHHGHEVNRKWMEEEQDHKWQDQKWKGWQDKEGKTYIDDDVLGYMLAEGGKSEGEKGSTLARRGVLEITRAVSLTPYAGDITFNAKSGEKGSTSLYGTEVHATRFQYGFALTPERLREPKRALAAMEALVHLGEVAGNQSRFLFDFSPESIVLRLTEDPAPRILYCFEASNGQADCSDLARRVSAGDVKADELFIGGPVVEAAAMKGITGAKTFPGVKKAFEAFSSALDKRLGDLL